MNATGYQVATMLPLLNLNICGCSDRIEILLCNHRDFTIVGITPVPLARAVAVSFQASMSECFDCIDRMHFSCSAGADKKLVDDGGADKPVCIDLWCKALDAGVTMPLGRWISFTRDGVSLWLIIADEAGQQDEQSDGCQQTNAQFLQFG